MLTLRSTRLRLAIGGALVVFLLGACEDPLGPFSEEHGWFFGLNATGLVVVPGDTIQMHAIAHKVGSQYSQPPFGEYSAWPAEHELRWWLSDSAVLRLGSDGRVEALSEGRAWVWIESGDRQDSAGVWVTERATSSRTFTEVVVANAHACALSTDSAAYCWGGNTRAQLGRGIPRRRTLGPSAVAVYGGYSFKQMAAGSHHTCGLHHDGTVYCWGSNLSGELGNGQEISWSEDNIYDFTSAKPVRVETKVRFKTIAAAGSSTCGLDLTDLAWCWGSNVSGVLGIGPERHVSVPTRVAVDVSFAAIAMGVDHTCALTADGHAYCWGSNSHGQLGSDCGYECSPDAEPVRTDVLFEAIAVARLTTCGLADNGAVHCWGKDLRSANQSFSTPTVISELPALRQISLGYDHACGVEDTGQAHCWGSNRHQQLGTAELDSLRFSLISAGPSNTCGVTFDELVYCWGENSQGQVGDGTLEYWKPVPARVIDW